MASAATKRAVLDSAKHLFARRGYDGASVRHICERAGVSANALHYHYGSKEGLYRSILEQFMGERLAAAERMLTPKPEDVTELRIRLQLFCDETLIALLQEPDVLVIAFAELQAGFTHGGQQAAYAIRRHENLLTDFLAAAQSEGLLRQDVDPAVVAGTLLERVTNQARYVEFHEDLWGTTPDNVAYRRHWIAQMVDLCLYGAASPRHPRAPALLEQSAEPPS